MVRDMDDRNKIRVNVRAILLALYGLFVSGSARYTTAQILADLGADRLIAGSVDAIMFGATALFLDRRISS